MKRIIIISIMILFSTLFLGLLFEGLGFAEEGDIFWKISARLGIDTMLWPFAFPLMGAMVMGLTLVAKPQTIMRLLGVSALGKSDLSMGICVLFGPVLAFLMQAGGLLFSLDLVTKQDLLRMVIALCMVYFLMMGNYMATVRRESGSGLRTPWSIRSDIVWQKTHRFLGRGLFLLSLIGMALLFFDHPMAVFYKFFGALVSLKIVAFAYSYGLWRYYGQHQT